MNPKSDKFAYFEAREIARRLCRELEPHCDRIEIAGSIRRQCSEVHDIEIVCLPKRNDSLTMFNVQGPPCRGFMNTVSQWERVKGSATGKYTQRIIQPEGIRLDLFMATPDNWGYILAIRTGSARYSRTVLASTWVRLGYKGIDGMLTKNGLPIIIAEEKDLFELLKIDYPEPSERNL